MAQITKIDPITFEAQSYSPQDEGLILSFPVNTELQSTGYIEFYVYDYNNNLISQDTNFKNYRIENSGKTDSPDNIQNIIISPEENLKDFSGTGGGQYIGFYSFLNYEIGNTTNQLFISEISSDRTEIRLESNSIPNLELTEITDDFIDKREESDYFLDFYLNFGNNNLIIANNLKIENEETNNPSILVKLYEPLPDTILLKAQLFLVTTINEPEAYRVYFEPEPLFVEGYDFLKGPNFSIPIKNQVNNSSQNLSYTDIISNTSTKSQNQIDSLLSQSAINISADYNNFSDFIHFSSAQTRIENFYYKVGLIETYTSESNALANTTGSFTSKQIIETKLSSVIANFDKFEYFMYYSSGSTVSYPKSNSIEPYVLFSTTSPQVLTWLGNTNENNSNFGGLLLSASNYDNTNPDQLKKSIPEYLREDPANQQYDLFVDMVAQYYDNIWLYTKDITQKYNADNRLDFGISKDLVSDAIKDFGIKLYQNNFSNKELYTAFLGMTPEGSLFPFPEITGSMPTPTGFELVDTLISASNDVISMDDTNKSLYKRIYHNIPYLLKSKGTLTGLRALITSYGIPDTILKISEFGGKDQVNANDYDLYSNNFNYAFNTTNNFITSSWKVNSKWESSNNRPATLQFRFKSEEFPPTNLSQSLWNIQTPSGITSELLIDYTRSGLASGSYDGSIKDPYYQYANLKFIPKLSNPNVSASISLPFYNGDWWSVMLESGSGGFNLYAGNKIYNGNDGASIGYYSSSFTTGANTTWTTSLTSNFASSSGNFPSYKAFSGLLQEIRYYKSQISESVFKDYIMNPLSFEGNGVNGAPDQLIFRAALGSELLKNTQVTSTINNIYGSAIYGSSSYGISSIPTSLTINGISTSSIHPKVTGSWDITSSFVNGSNFYFNDTPSHLKNIETFFLDQPAVGIKNRITDKIRSESDTLPSGNVLSPIRSLSQTTEASASYTDNINYLEVAFSPQNQINDDIIGQMGHFNIGDYIGDPAQRFTGNNYPDLNNLSEEYFKKYIKQYDLVDFVRLIKFFDNSLFKMIKDFIPARTSLASGLVIKQHLLERNKYAQPQVSYSEEDLTGCINSYKVWNTASQETEISCSKIVTPEGGPAGMFNPFNNEYEFFISSSISTVEINTNVSASLQDPGLLSYNPSDAPAGGGLYIDVTNDSSFSQNAHNISHFNLYINEGNALYAVAFLVSNLDSNLNPLPGSLALNFFKTGEGRPTPISPITSIFTTSTTTGNKVFQTPRPQRSTDVSDVSTLGIDGLLSTDVVFFFVTNDVPASGDIEFGYLGSDILANNLIPSSSFIPNQTILHDIYTYPSPPQFNVTQSFSVTTPSLSGSVTRIHRSEDEFYNGELSGSVILATNGELNPHCEQFKFINPQGGQFGIRVFSSASGDNFNDFINSEQKPLKGFIETYFIEDQQTGIPPANPVINSRNV